VADAVLTQLLKLPQDPNRLANGDVNAPFRWAEVLHLRSPVVMVSYRRHQNLDLGGFNTVDLVPQDAESRGTMPGAASWNPSSSRRPGCPDMAPASFHVS